MKDSDRVLAKDLARELTPEECEAVSGGNCTGTLTYTWGGGKGDGDADLECSF